VGFRGNLSAKDALDGDIADELIPFSDFKSRVNKHVLELWQSDSEWDEFPENKLHKKLKVLHYLCSDRQKTRDCDMWIPHWSLLRYSFLFVEE